MKKLVTLLLVISAVSISCNSQKQEKPSYLIDEEKMVSVMVDMHIVETAHNLKLLPPDSTGLVYNETFERIYVTHAITKTDFDSSLFYYTTQTEQMSVIYDKILEKLYELESEANADHSDQ
ncbi:MAG: DUF4296 domain-containing protein [Flavobacteriales bacterium]